MNQIDRINADRLLEAASRHSAQKAKRPEITEVWKSDWLAVKGDNRFAQVVVGKSSLGFHPGLRIKRVGRTASMKWGAAMSSQEQAVAASQSTGSGWLGAREAQIADPGVEEKRMEALERRFTKGPGMRV